VPRRDAASLAHPDGQPMRRTERTALACRGGALERNHDAHGSALRIPLPGPPRVTSKLRARPDSSRYRRGRPHPSGRCQALQRVKAYLALHNCYGVDLNATAVELAEITLWLDAMHPGLRAPSFGPHLRRGNSLIGARRETWTPAQVAKRGWLTTVTTARPLRTALSPYEVHHFLLPAAGWGAVADTKEAKEGTPERHRRAEGLAARDGGGAGQDRAGPIGTAPWFLRGGGRRGGSVRPPTPPPRARGRQDGLQLLASAMGLPSRARGRPRHPHLSEAVGPRRVAVVALRSHRVLLLRLQHVAAVPWCNSVVDARGCAP
jgi:hypothetical protein